MATAYYPPKPYKVLGKRKQDTDGGLRVTGRAQFPIDFSLPGMLHGKTLRCPYPKTKVISVDGSAAAALPGVKLVMSYFNFPEVFVEPFAYYAGEEVAAVIAVDEDTAAKALDLIKVTYERDNNFVLDMLDAMKPGAPIVTPGDKSNVYVTPQPYWTGLTPATPENPTGLWTKSVQGEVGGFGDVEQGFKESDVIVQTPDLQYSFSKQPSSMMRAHLSDYRADDPNYTLTVYSNSKGHHDIKIPWANYIKLPQSRVRHVGAFAGFMGGMAGCMDPGDRGERGGRIATSGSKALGKPVRFAYDHYEEHFYSWSKYSLCRIKLGFKSDGRLHAMDHEEYVECGTYGSSSVGSAARAGGMLQYNRNCKHMKIRTYRVATNRLKQRDFNGIGTAPCMYHMGFAMDMAAEQLKMDPVELMKMNCMQKGSFDAHWGRPLAYLDNPAHPECLDYVAKVTDWKNQWGGWGAPKTKTGVIRHGIGSNLKTHTGGGWAGSSALIKMLPDGTAMVLAAMGDSGQNEPTTACALTAEVLGIPYENVKMKRDSSDQPYVLNLGGSTGTWNVGWSVWGAAVDCREKVLTAAAGLFTPVPPITDLDMNEKGVFLKSAPTVIKTLPQVFARQPVEAAREICGYAYIRDPNGLAIPRESGAAIWSLDVDTETGEIFNMKAATANGRGLIMNPQICANQDNQGITQGGQQQKEHAYTDKSSGRNLTYSWIFTNIHTIMDVDVYPDGLGALSGAVEKEGGKAHPFGANAAAEGQPNPHLGAIANALYNALGVRFPVAPYTPDKILKALGKG